MNATKYVIFIQISMIFVKGRLIQYNKDLLGQIEFILWGQYMVKLLNLKEFKPIFDRKCSCYYFT